MLSPGDCVLIETNSDEYGVIQSHLFIIVLEPEKHTHNTVVVPVESCRSDKYDHTTLLQPGDHDFIIRQSFVSYRRSEIVSTDRVEELLNDGYATPHKPMRQDALQRVCDGVLRSRFTPYDVQEMYRNAIFRNI